jgi:hypothetical protein
MYGHAGFAALYLVSGLAGSLATSLRANAVSAGASGAIFGVFGAFGAFLFLHRNRLDKEQVSKQARGLMIFLVYNIWFGVTAKGIDLVAHFGGLVAGFGVGLALELGTHEDQSTSRRSILVALLGTALMFGVAMVAPQPTNSLISFAAVETPVLARWNQLVPQIQSSSIPDDKLAEIIEKELLPPWRAAHKEFEKEDRSSDRAEMLEYMTAREEGWDLMAKGLRAQDQDLVMQGRKRFSDADAVISRMNLRRTLSNRK